MTETHHPLAMRVENSLRRLGFSSVRVDSDDGGEVKLVGYVSNSDERAMVIAATRCTVGVVGIQCDLQHRS